MVGGNKNFDLYFTTLRRYIQLIKRIPDNIPILDNFASLFTLIANSEGTAGKLNKDVIKRLLSEYLISSMIDISESVLDFDFTVKLRVLPTPDGQGPLLCNTQLEVDTRADQKMQLITPDCIFVPFQFN